MFVQGENGAVAVTMPLFMILLLFGQRDDAPGKPAAFIAAVMPFAPSYHMTESLRAVMMQGKTFELSCFPKWRCWRSTAPCY